MKGYNVTAICEECQARYKGSVLGRGDDDPAPLLVALAKGWEALHADHQQIVVASPR